MNTSSHALLLTFVSRGKGCGGQVWSCVNGFAFGIYIEENRKRALLII